MEKIQEFLASIGSDHDVQRIEHVWSGAPGNRKMTGISIVELSSRDRREAALKKVTEESSKILGEGDSKVSVGRAKTEFQRNRNTNLRKAEEVLKKDARTNGKVVKIEWKLDGNSKNRVVTMGEQTVFLQTPNDLSGHFVAPFLDVSF